MRKSFSISICVPAFNEEKNLKEAVEDLLNTLFSYVQEVEIIIVDDGSTDSTPQLAKQIAKDYSEVKVIHHKRRLGIGACYRDALAIAKEDYFTWFPADHENSAEEFIQCLPYLDEKTVVTCHHLGGDPRSVLRRMISRSFTWILNKYFNLTIKYYNGLTIFPTSASRSFPLISDGFLFTSENLIKAIKRGYQVIELPVPLRKREGGKTKIFTILSFTQILRDIFCILMK